TTVAPGDTVDFGNTDENIVVNRTDDGLTFDLAKNIDLGSDGSLTTGNTVVNNDGLMVGGPDSGASGTQVEAGKITVWADPSTGIANEIVIDANTGTIEGLSNRDLDGDDFGEAGRAATEEQLGLVRGEIGELAE